jgi:type IV pilus assembly protein PilA
MPPLAAIRSPCRSPTTRTRRPGARTDGFTIIEILIVISILGILMALTIFNLGTYRKRPNDVAALQCGKAIVTAQVSFRSEHPTYATSVTDLGIDVTRPCADIEVDARTPSSNATTGTGSINGNADDYAFQVWSTRGLNVFAESYLARINLKKLEKTP